MQWRGRRVGASLRGMEGGCICRNWTKTARLVMESPRKVGYCFSYCLFFHALRIESRGAL